MSATLPYSNTTASGWSESTDQAKLLTNYKVIKDTPSRVVLGNRTANLSEDIIVNQYDDLTKGVIPPKELTVDYPTKSKRAAMATVATWTVVTEPAADGMDREDFPVCFSLQVKASLASTITNDVLNDLWEHFRSSLIRDASGDVDFRSYLLGSLRPDRDNPEPL